MYWAAGTNYPVRALICTTKWKSFKWKGKYLILLERRTTPTINYDNGCTKRARSLIFAFVRASTHSCRQW